MNNIFRIRTLGYFLSLALLVSLVCACVYTAERVRAVAGGGDSGSSCATWPVFKKPAFPGGTLHNPAASEKEDIEGGNSLSTKVYWEDNLTPSSLDHNPAEPRSNPYGWLMTNGINQDDERTKEALCSGGGWAWMEYRYADWVEADYNQWESLVIPANPGSNYNNNQQKHKRAIDTVGSNVGIPTTLITPTRTQGERAACVDTGTVYVQVVFSHWQRTWWESEPIYRYQRHTYTKTSTRTATTTKEDGKNVTTYTETTSTSNHNYSNWVNVFKHSEVPIGSCEPIRWGATEVGKKSVTCTEYIAKVRGFQYYKRKAEIFDRKEGKTNNGKGDEPWLVGIGGATSFGKTEAHNWPYITPAKLKTYENKGKIWDSGGALNIVKHWDTDWKTVLKQKFTNMQLTEGANGYIWDYPNTRGNNSSSLTWFCSRERNSYQHIASQSGVSIVAGYETKSDYNNGKKTGLYNGETIDRLSYVNGTKATSVDDPFHRAEAAATPQKKGYVYKIRFTHYLDHIGAVPDVFKADKHEIPYEITTTYNGAKTNSYPGVTWTKGSSSMTGKRQNKDGDWIDVNEKHDRSNTVLRLEDDKTAITEAIYEISSPNQQLEICQTIKYKENRYIIGADNNIKPWWRNDPVDGKGSAYNADYYGVLNDDLSKYAWGEAISTACVTINAIPEVDYCPVYDTAFTGVRNLHAPGNGEFIHAYKNTSNVSIYARPGDPVQFDHGLCNDESANSFRIYANRKGTYKNGHQNVNDPKYLFGTRKPVLANTSIPLDMDSGTVRSTNNNYNNSSGSKIDANKVFGRNFTIYSPSGTTKYFCETDFFSFRTQYLKDNARTYGVPGFSIADNTQKSKCKSQKAEQVNQPSDVGKTISQRMTYGGKTYTASVKIPYNFTTKLESGILNTDDKVYTGENVRGKYHWWILPRINKSIISAISKVNSKDSVKDNKLETSYKYATVTPEDTTISVVEFVLKWDTPFDVAKTLVADNNNVNNPCKYIENKIGRYLVEVGASKTKCHISDQQTGALNGDGDYNGDEGGSDEYMRRVPDVEDGSKYCLMVGINHTDSHNKPNAEVLNSGDDGPNGESLDNASPNWHLSGASCIAVAKKPNFQTWGGIYSKGGINTSLSPKYLGTGFGADDGNGITLFGSWSEYETVSLKNIKGFSSGSALGYAGTTPALGLPGGHEKVGYCELSKMTIEKNECSSNVTGKAGISLSNSTFLARLKARYLPAGSNTTTPKELDADTDYIKVSGSYTINGLSKSKDDAKKTLVIYATGDVTITNNICYGNDGACHNNKIGTDNNLSLDLDGSTTYDAITKSPQIIIFADGNINIEGNRDNNTQGVTWIDAWLIANADSSGGGIINTCSNRPEKYTSKDCNRTLIINGPVFASGMELNRTAGAYPDSQRVYDSRDKITKQNLENDGSITPAEIFNFRPDALYWGYSQSQRYSQATVTYSHELAPRY